MRSPLSALLLCVSSFGAVLSAETEDGQRTIELPGAYSQFAFGDKRYVALHIDSQNMAIVYDMIAGKEAFRVEQVMPGDLLAGSSEKLVVVSPSKMMIRRWHFDTGKRDKLALIDSDDTPRTALLGCTGHGPLLLLGEATSLLIDLDTLKPIDVTGPMVGGQGRHGLSVHVSADGLTFGTIPIGYGPVSYAMIHIDRTAVARIPFGSTSNAIRWAQPSGDGHLLMMPGGAIVNRNGRPIKAAWLEGATMIPSPDPRYVLDVRVDQKDEDGKRVGKITVCTTADCRPLVTETGFAELLPRQIHSWHDIASALRLGHQWRVRYLPKADLLVTLPADNDRIVLRPFDLQAKLNATSDRYLFVESVPPLQVTAGQKLAYRPSIRSSQKKARVSLADGPANARVTRSGTLQWAVPVDYAEPWARFLLCVRDAAGDEIFHSFEVAVRQPELEKP